MGATGLHAPSMGIGATRLEPAVARPRVETRRVTTQITRTDRANRGRAAASARCAFANGEPPVDARLDDDDVPVRPHVVEEGDRAPGRVGGTVRSSAPVASVTVALGGARARAAADAARGAVAGPLGRAAGRPS